jgi:hypothetical protein
MYIFIFNLFATKLLRNRSNNVLTNSALLSQNKAIHTILNTTRVDKSKFNGIYFKNETDNFNYKKQFEIVKLINELKRSPKITDPREKLELNIVNITKGGLLNDFNFIF